MDHDLIERYIYAVTKGLPGKTRNDVAKELQTLISDMLEERCGDVMPTEKDIRVVLTELGTPGELYEQYMGDSKKCLIGPPYYTTYVYVMKIVLLCTAFGMTLAFMLSLFVGENNEAIWFLEIFRWFGMLLSGSLSSFAFVTALFAFFYHKEIPIDGNLGLDNLPPVPEKKERISKAETIFGIGISIVFMLIFLICPQIFCAVTKEGELIPIFSIRTIRGTWYIIILFGILGIIREIVKLIDGKYTKRVMITAAATDFLSALCTVWWLVRDDIMNPEFTAKIGGLFEGESVRIMNLFANFQYFFMGVILFALLLDVVTIVVKGIRLSKESALL